MGQTQTVGSHKTTIGTDRDERTYVQYHATRVVAWDAETVTLNSGGYETVTTKLRMNQASNQFRLGFQVFQKDYYWFVDLPNGDTVEFFDGITFKR